MKKLLYVIGISIIWCSCNSNNYMPAFDFKLFANTPVWELANAVEKEDVKRIEVILKDISINVDFHEPKFGNTLLMLAVVNNKKKSVKKLLEGGANPNEIDYYENAIPIIYASDNYSEDCDSSILKCLIEYHADVNYVQIIDRIESTGAHSFVKQTVLMTAVKNKCLGIIKVLVSAGADINKIHIMKVMVQLQWL